MVVIVANKKAVMKINRSDKLFRCVKCGKDSNSSSFSSVIRNGYYDCNESHLPFCKDCVNEMYDDFIKNCYDGNDRQAVRRICCMFNIYYHDDIFDFAQKWTDGTVITNYFRSLGNITFKNHKNKTYTDTILDDNKLKYIDGDYSVNPDEPLVITKEIKQFFGTGFTPEEYAFLKKEYDDWTARHECKTKTQEEVFKSIVFNRLDAYKARLKKESTKDIEATFQNLLATAKLQPKQNIGESIADNQTLGTLIEKWEQTRPIPKMPDDLKDIDNIGLYNDIFFKGHLSKAVGINNGLSNLYDDFMKKYTVEKLDEEYDDGSDMDFDKIFGQSDLGGESTG